MELIKRIDLKSIEQFKDFDRYEGNRRTEIKVYDRTINYRGFDIKRNIYIPKGAVGYYEVPKLKYIDIGGIKEGFLSTSISFSKETIDKYFELNHKLNE